MHCVQERLPALTMDRGRFLSSDAARREPGVQHVLRKQRGANLSARMKHAMRTILVEANAVVIVGADRPILDVHHSEQMFAALRDGAEVAAIPAEDGGYVAIGVSNAERARLNAVLDALFDNMPWGTAQVMACTRERLRWISAQWHELPIL